MRCSLLLTVGLLLLLASRCWASDESVSQQASLQQIFCDGDRWCLWLGSHLSVTEQALQARNISAVLSVVDYTAYTGFELLRTARHDWSSSSAALLPYEEQRLHSDANAGGGWLGACAEFTTTTLWLPAVDATKFKFRQTLELALEFIGRMRSNGQSLLVHCVEGKSRSASVVIAFIMEELGLAFSQALEYVRRLRPVVNPNDGFRRLLLSRSAESKSSAVCDKEEDEDVGLQSVDFFLLEE